MTRTNEHGLPVGEPVAGWTPRPLPEPGPFRGRYCSVVPLSVSHAEGLYPTCAAPGTERLWTYLSDGPHPDLDAFRARIARAVDDPTAVAVAVLGPQGVPVGLANYLRLDPANGSVEVGGILLGAALRLGFRYEGTFRNAVVYKGRNRDTAWFSITDDEWPGVAAAHRAWLDPANFDEDGLQRTPLAARRPQEGPSIS